MWLTNWEIDPIIPLKFLFSLFDLGIVFFVYKFTDAKKAFLYAINPITILVTCFQGQFDVVPVFFLILTAYLLNKNKQLMAIVSYSLAILIKTWPIIFLVSFLRFSKKNRWQWLLIIFLPIISILIYGYFFHADLFVIFQTVKNYRGTYENWGIGKWIITAIFSGNEDIKNIFRKLFFLSFIVYAFINPKKNLYQNLYAQLLFFFSFTPTFGIQWLVWITPFIFITKQKEGFWLMTIITIFLVANYLPWIYSLINPEFLFFSNLINFLTWISFIYFFVRLNRKWLKK